MDLMASVQLRFLPVFLTILAGSAAAADATCKTLADANSKIYAQPVHMYFSEAAAGKTRSSELVYLNGRTYVQLNGAWQVSRIVPRTMNSGNNALDPNTTCRVLRDDFVNGEAAVLYSTAKQTWDERMDSQVWISKTRGLPLKIEMDIDVGKGAVRTHRTMVYSYNHVSAPAGVH